MLSATHPGGLAPAFAGGAQRAPTTYLSVVLLAALSYQLWLCGLHTNLGIGGNTIVILAEVALLAACAPLLVKPLPLGFWLTLTLIFANGVALALIRGHFDPKPLRDLMVPMILFATALQTVNEADADRILRRAVWLVLAIGLFEFVFVDLFTRLFDIYSYYIARGVGDPQMGLYRDDKLAASGLRPEGIGRTILPFLGAHRASSVFIEPVSFGNFAVICAAWGLAKDQARRREGLFFVGAAALMLVLCDSRFGLVSIALLFLLRLLLLRGGEILGLLFPPICALAVILVSIATGGEYSDSFVGRLTLTGKTLTHMRGGEIFGVLPPIYGYFDMGYPYVLANFGIIACLLLWGAIWLVPMATDTGRRFRTYAALYLALILCVSGTSVFAFKTSAMLWFLFGSLAGKAGTPTEAPR